MTKLRYVEQPRSATRDVVSTLLSRAKKFHCSVTVAAEYDVTALRARLDSERRSGREISMAAYLVKATAKLLEEQPHLNRHQFTSLFGTRRIVEFESIHCTLVVAREDAQQREMLLPALLRDPNKRALDDIQREIRTLKSTALDELPLARNMQKLERLPRLAVELLSFKARSDPEFYLKHFGTYGLSSLMRTGGHGMSGHTVANTGVAFLPGSIRRLPRFVDGTDKVEARDIMSFGLVFDHYIVDGMQMLAAIERLAALVEDPSTILDPKSS